MPHRRSRARRRTRIRFPDRWTSDSLRSLEVIDDDGSAVATLGSSRCQETILAELSASAVCPYVADLRFADANPRTREAAAPAAFLHCHERPPVACQTSLVLGRIGR